MAEHKEQEDKAAQARYRHKSWKKRLVSSVEFKPQIRFEDAYFQLVWEKFPPRVRLGILLDSRRKMGGVETLQPKDRDGAGQQAPLTLSASQFRESPVFVMYWWQLGHLIGQLPTPPPVVTGQEEAVLATQDWWIQRKAGKQPQNTYAEPRKVPGPQPYRSAEAPVSRTPPTQ